MRTGSQRELVSIQFETTEYYEKNLTTLIELIEKCSDYSIIAAPEVCLTGFDYNNFEAASQFFEIAVDRIFSILKNRVLILTVIEKDNDRFYNRAKVLHVEQIIHSQGKSKLFKLGYEDKFFTPASSDEIRISEIDGIKIAILICFELRFKELWKKVEGADVIVIPARWGKLREQNFVSLTNALAIMNQAYVICSDATNSDSTSQSAVISPFGKEIRSNDINIMQYDKKEIVKMRRYLDVGIG